MTTRQILSLAACGSALAIASAYAQPAAAPAAAPAPAASQADQNRLFEQLTTYPAVLTFDRPEGQPKGGGLTVTSPSFGPSGEVPAKYTGRGASASPTVNWTRGPTGTKSYVLLFEDGVANRNREGIVHWLAFNIPADVTSLPEGLSVKGQGAKQPPGTMREGANVDNTIGYTGMFGSPFGNNYHMQIFALDTLLNLPFGATRDQVWEAMNHHVLASGKTIGTYRSPPAPPPADPAAAAAANANAAANVIRALTAPTVITMDRPQGQLPGSLKVSSSSFSTYGPDGVIPRKFTGRGESVSPAATWTAGPKATKAYVLMFEDGVENTQGDGTLYWLAYNIPASVLRLPENASKTATFRQGLNSEGKAGYAGMKGIPGAPAFRYHLQVFALDAPLPLDAGATRDQVRAAMKGHVLARGQLTATYQPPGPGQANLPPAPTHW